jgi:hypothetical protein
MNFMIILVKNTLKHILRSSAGYTVIEILVSGILMTFSVSAVVAVVGTGTHLGSSDNHRRQARAIVRSVFEQEYDFRDYNTVPDNGSSIGSVEIDSREGNPLIGDLRREIVTDTMTAGNGSKFPVKRVTLVLKWLETANVPDSITLTKVMAKAQ